VDTIIKNGTIVTASGMIKADIGIKDGKIVCIGENLEGSEKVIDAKGMYAMPGGVEPHAHFSVPFFGTVSCDDYTSGTKAAAFGGTTTVIDFATQEKGQSMLDTYEDRRKMADGKTCIDYSFHLIVTDFSKEVLNDMPALVEKGVPSIKVYMVYKKEGLMTDDGEIYRLLQATKECGAMLSVHAENPSVIDLLTDEFVEQGNVGPWYHYLSRPEFVSAEATKRVVHLAKAAEAPLYVVHVSDKESMESIIEVKNEGYEIYAETCPHYLEFTSDVYKRPDGKRFVCSPPMKGQESQDALWMAINNDKVSTIGSDHCPFKAAEKDNDVAFPMTPNGCMGIETRYPYMISEALKGKISLCKAAELCATNPAKVFGCREKGAIEVGKDADIILVSAEESCVLADEHNHSKVDHSIWNGYENKGAIKATICRGKVVVENGQFVGEDGWGHFIARKR